MEDLKKIMFGNVMKMMLLKWGIIIGLNLVARKMK